VYRAFPVLLYFNNFVTEDISAFRKLMAFNQVDDTLLFFDKITCFAI
jgi:hypothetical protein